MAALASVLLAVALAMSIALMALTVVLGHETTRMGVADARMRASLRTRAALLWFARESDLANSQPSDSARQERSLAESELRSALAETRRLATPQRVTELDNLIHKSDAYIALRKQLGDEGLPLGVLLARATPSLELVFADLQRLVDSDARWEGSVEASAQYWGSVARVWGGCATGVLLLGFAAVIAGTHALVERPLLALNAVMNRFAKGDQSSRSTPGGARELQQVATTFNEMADRLVHQNEERLVFLAGVAHDLRNPITALKLATRSAEREGATLTAEKAARTLSMVARQVDRLDRMVGDLLDAAQIEAGRFELRMKEADLRVLVANVVDLFRGASDSHELVVIAPDDPVVVECDPGRIEQVLINLLSNAMKYSPQGRRVTLSTSIDGAGAAIAVADEGIGIPPEERERIFERFYRAPQSQEQVPGVGLGLSVARKLVEAHGGRLEVESQLGKGSTFRVLLGRRGATVGLAAADRA